MFATPPILDLSVLQTAVRSDPVSEGQYAENAINVMEQVFETVQKTINKKLEYRIKEYSKGHGTQYEIGSHVLVLNPARKSGEPAKLNRGWSLPFKITKTSQMYAIKWKH